MLAEGIRTSFQDLFAINTKAHDLGVEDVKNKLRTMYAGKKTDLVIGNIAKTFRALCDYADFSASVVQASATSAVFSEDAKNEIGDPVEKEDEDGKSLIPSKLKISGLQYHINILLPETRDQAVYDALFKSLREHLG